MGHERPSTMTEIRVTDRATGEQRRYDSVESLPTEMRTLLERAARGETEGAETSASEAFVVESPDGSAAEFASMDEAVRFVNQHHGVDLQTPQAPGEHVIVQRAAHGSDGHLRDALVELAAGIAVLGIVYLAISRGWIVP